jgi:hypothetical protein
MQKKFLYSFLIIILLNALSFSVYAHKINQSYIYLKVYESSISGRFEITVKDLNKAIGTNFINEVSVSELLSNFDLIEEYYKSRTEFSSEYGIHEIEFLDPEILNPGGGLGNFIQFNFSLPDITIVPEDLKVRYDIDYEKYDNHTGLLIIEYNWKAGIHNNESLPSLFFDSSNTADTVNLAEGSLMTGFIGMVKQGIWHIWIGIDHILFLFALILPSVIRRNDHTVVTSDKIFSAVAPAALLNPTKQYWVPVERFRPAFLYILKIITFFTISHTITLGLAASGIIALPSSLVESIIALSIAMAAYHNIQPIFKGKEWVIAFVFGLFHGFGFASVLSELRVGEYLGLTLFGFNLGVELGQVVVIIALFPILFFLRKSRLYNYLLIYGSFLLIFISLYWFVERAFDYDLQLGKFFIDMYRSVLG